MNELKVFENETFGQIRTTVIEGEPWFVATDVCKALGITNASESMKRLDAEERSSALVTTKGGNQRVNVVNKNGLMNLVLASRKQKAKEYKRWLIDVVFPRLHCEWSLAPSNQGTISGESSLSIFNNEQFGNVRVKTDDNGEPWFVATDVCKILSLTDTSKTMERIDSEDKRVYDGIRTGTYTLSAWCVNESGLYCLIMESVKPEARTFKRWITHEVLPSIRKHGVYAIDEMLNNPDALIAALTELKAERERTKSLTETVAIQNQQITEMQPKVSYYDVVLNCKDLVSISVIAKDYGWSANRMNEYLHEKGIQYKQGGKIWLLYQKYAEMGYTSTKTHSYPGTDGEMHASVHTYWTQAGRLFIYDLLKSDNILPMIERTDADGDAA